MLNKKFNNKLSYLLTYYIPVPQPVNEFTVDISSHVPIFKTSNSTDIQGMNCIPIAVMALVLMSPA